MTRPVPSNFPFVFVVAVALSGFSARQSLADGQTCVTCGAIRICLEWSQVGNPFEDVDFRVECATFPPDIELITGDSEWRIDSWDNEIFERASIGTITIDPSVPPAIFNVTIATDTGGVGARNLNTIALVAGAPWTGNSSLAGAISGNLGRVSVVERFGNGGELDFWIGGDVGGLLEIPDLVSLHIEGELKASARIDLMDQHLTGPLIIEGGGAGDIINGGSISSVVILADAPGNSWDGDITFNNLFAPGVIATTGGADLNGAINVNGDLGGRLQIFGSMNGQINIAEDATSPFPLYILSKTRGDITINGDVIQIQILLLGGLEGGTLTIVGDVRHIPPIAQPIILIDDLVSDAQGNPSVVNLQGNFGGILVLDSGIKGAQQVRIGGEFTSDASIDLLGQDVAGLLEITGGGGGALINGLAVSGTVTLADGATKSYTGDAAFASVASGGEIRTLNGADLAGDLSISDDVIGDISVSGAMTSASSVAIDGALAAAGLAGAGRILVSGICDGDIQIAKQTDNLTLIHLLGGLDTNAAVEINTSGGAFDAEGDINVGPATPPNPPNDITFDGCIRIHSDGQTPPRGGDLNGGTITVIGCHATTADLNICLDGGDGGENIYIKQGNCPNQVDWSCGTCP